MGKGNPFKAVTKVFGNVIEAPFNVASGIVDIYVRLAVAGYISRLIPDNWFAGMAHVE